MRKVLFLGFIIACDARLLMKEHHVRDIYNKYVLPDLTAAYANRYNILPLSENNNPRWKWESKDLPRVIAVLEFKRFVQTHHLSCKKGLGINGKDPEWDYIRAQEFIQINYTDNKDLYDLHTLNLGHKDFDFVMLNGVVA